MPATETVSGKQSVLFSSPVPVAANQTFTCGYYAPNGHYSYDNSAFVVQKNSPPLHGLVNGGVYVYGTQPTAMPVSFWQASSHGVDLLFSTSTSTGSATWISGANVSLTSSGATVTWNTSVPSDSQVEYGSTTSYGNTTALAAARVTSHAITMSNLVPGTAYHFRVRSGDSDGVPAVGLDHTFALAPPVSVSVSPANSIVVSAKTQQFTSLVSNTLNTAVTWSARAGPVSSSGLFTAPTVGSATPVNVTATSQADSSKSATMALTVNPVPAVLPVNPASLSFSGQVGTNLTPASVSITNAGAGTLTFTGMSDQPWLMLSADSGTAPSSLQVSPSATGLKAGTYSRHVTMSGGGLTRSVP